MGKKAVFKAYTQSQYSLLPVSLDELIPDNHPVRVLNEVINKLDIKALEDCYVGGGSSSYHPKMLLKTIIYGYLNNIYSSRKIEMAIKENIHFMWLSGMSRPDHHTINRFRGQRLKHVIKDIFTQVVKLLNQSGHVSLQEVYTDGTKIEANANRYTFVWGNSIKTNKDKIEKQLQELWEYAEKVTESEKNDPTPPDFTPTDSEKVRQTIEQINEKLQGATKIDKKVSAKLKYAEKNWPKTIDKYNEQEKILGGRNSYSKTDKDATFMRMKEDHMKNGQLKPAYNLQISCHNQIITNYSVHQNPTDTRTFIPHLEQFIQQYGTAPQLAVADAGYGSEENYEFLENKEIISFVKYNNFDREQSTIINAKKPFSVEKLFYDKSTNTVICPMGQHMQHLGTFQIKNESGFIRQIDKYQAINCNNCPLRATCHNSKQNRIVEISHQGNKYKINAAENLKSEDGIKYRKRRCHEPEPIFANIKHNKKFNRFMLRGLEKVTIEAGLIAIAHNLRKIA